jgi:hypothetical protein
MIENATAAAETLLELSDRNDDDPDRVVVVSLGDIRRRVVIAKPSGEPLSPYQFPSFIERICAMPELMELTPVALTLQPVGVGLVAHGGRTNSEFDEPTDFPAEILQEIAAHASATISQRDAAIYVLIVEEIGN